jgi:hypothetical protein
MGPLLIPEISIPRGLAVLKWKWGRLLIPEISRLAKSRLLAQPPYSSRTRSALTCVKGGSPDSFEPFQNRCVVEFPLCASSVRVDSESANRVCRALQMRVCGCSRAGTSLAFVQRCTQSDCAAGAAHPVGPPSTCTCVRPLPLYSVCAGRFDS